MVNFSESRSKSSSLQRIAVLPEVADYEPSENGEPPLAKVKEWVTYKGSANDVGNDAGNEIGQRITDTMPGSAGSSWYFKIYRSTQ